MREAERLREWEEKAERFKANFDRLAEHIYTLENDDLNEGDDYEEDDEHKRHYDDDEPDYERMDDDDEGEEYQDASQPDLDRYRRLFEEDVRDYAEYWGPKENNDGHKENNYDQEEHEEEMPDEDPDVNIPDEHGEASEDDQNVPGNRPAANEDLQAEIDMWKQQAEAEHVKWKAAEAEIARLQGQLQKTQQPVLQQSDAMDPAMDTAMEIDVPTGSSDVPQADLHRSSHASQRGRGSSRRGGSHRGRGGSHHRGNGGGRDDRGRGDRGDSRGRATVQTGRRRRRRHPKPTPPTRPIVLPRLGNHQVLRYPPERYLRTRTRCQVEVNVGLCVAKNYKEWHEQPLPED